MPTALDYIIQANQGIESRLAADSKASNAQRLGIQEILGQSKIQNDKDRAAAILQESKDRSESGRMAFKEFGIRSPTLAGEINAPATPQDELARIVAEAGRRVGLGNAKTLAETRHQLSSSGITQAPGTIADTTEVPRYMNQYDHPNVAAAKEQRTVETGKKVTKADTDNKALVETTERDSETTKGSNSPTKRLPDPRIVIDAVKKYRPELSEKDIIKNLDGSSGTFVFTDPVSGKRFAVDY